MAAIGKSNMAEREGVSSNAFNACVFGFSLNALSLRYLSAMAEGERQSPNPEPAVRVGVAANRESNMADGVGFEPTRSY